MTRVLVDVGQAGGLGLRKYLGGGFEDEAGRRGSDLMDDPVL